MSRFTAPLAASLLALAASLTACARVHPPTEARPLEWDDRSLDPIAPSATPVVHDPSAPASAPLPSAPAAPGAAPVVTTFQEPVPTTRAPIASRLAELDDAACRAEITRRGLAVTGASGNGVATPMRLAGPLSGVRFVLPRAPSPHGVLDCRLVLTLDAFAQAIAPRGVVEVRVDNTYRPGAHLPGKKRASQHAHALAVDLTRFTLADGRTLVVADDWHDPIGSIPCGPEAAPDSTAPNALALRELVCDVARRGVFHHVLTPSYDAAHRDHLHLDIKRGGDKVWVR